MKECPACRRCFPDHVNHCPDDGDATTLSIAGEPILDGRYQLERRLGHGGMGVVFQARHIFLKTAHAIKVILPDLVGNDPMLVTRFRQEALAAAAIRHPNIIAVTDFGVTRGTMPFLVMEYVKGKSLQELLAQEGALPPGRALEIMGAIGAGVGAAHRQGIVHRDLKPLNIMMQEDMTIAEGLKVLDFGLAKIKSGELLGSFVQAKTSGLMGSPFYMAPEQWGDEEPDARADIYSLGVILFQMLGGDVPFRGTGIPSIMKKHLTAEPPSLSSMGVSVPPQIEAVVRHTLEKEAENRPRTVEDFINELREAVTSVSAGLKSTSLGQIVMPPLAGATSTHSYSSGPLPTPDEMTALRVQTNPPQARVFVNNVSVGTSDQNGALLVADMMPGTHYVRVHHEGYADWEQQIECSGGECRVEAQLHSQTQTGQLQTSQPPSGDALAGTISSGMLEEVEPLGSVISYRSHENEQALLDNEQRDRFAREELAREEEARLRAQAATRQQEEDARRKAEEEARQKAEAERLRAEAEARTRAEEEARKQAALEAERRAAAEAERQERERREREEAERAAAAARREQEERRAALPEQTVAHRATTQPQGGVNPAQTQYQREGVTTGPVESGSLPGAGMQHTGWQHEHQQTLVNSQPQLHGSVPDIAAAAHKKSVMSLALIAVLSVLLIGGGITAYLFWPGGRQAIRRSMLRDMADAVAKPPAPGSSQTEIKPDLVEIPGGTFQMGRNVTSDMEILEGPPHAVAVQGFAMDRTEVTNAEYEVFVRETKHRAPSDWVDNKPPKGDERLPVTNVSYDDAVAFAAWRSQRDKAKYRLPTEEEWEYAARNGDQNTLYPWGNTWAQGRAVVEEVAPKPVGSLPNGKDRWGVVDLIGNVWEWTSTKASLYPGNDKGIVPPAQREMMVYRGGSYATNMSKTPATGTVRNWQTPSKMHPTLGFRLVRSSS